MSGCGVPLVCGREERQRERDLIEGMLKGEAASRGLPLWSLVMVASLTDEGDLDIQYRPKEAP